jgi:hypothetical protein
MSTPDEVNLGTSSLAHFTDEGQVIVFEPPFVNTRVKHALLLAGTPLIVNVVAAVIVFVKQVAVATFIALADRAEVVPMKFEAVIAPVLAFRVALVLNLVELVLFAVAAASAIASNEYSALVVVSVWVTLLLRSVLISPTSSQAEPSYTNSYTLLAAKYPAEIAELRYCIALAPVELTFKVGLEAVLVTVNLTVILAPVARVNPDKVTAFSTVAASVEHSAKLLIRFLTHDVVAMCVVFELSSGFGAYV